MKSWIRQSVLRRCSFILVGAVPLAAWSQGPLLPAGAPAPTMKTLDQVEPRIPIGQADVPITITNKGSYLLTGNLTLALGAAITVDADDVAIDLNGFTITSGDYAIEIAAGRTGARIRNGVIRDTFDAGVSGNSADNVELRDLRIINCFNSVNLNDHARVIDCVIDTSGEGAVSLQRNAFVRDCAFYRCSSGETALLVDDGSEVRDCVFTDNGIAISVRDNCMVAGNLCRSNAFTHIRVFGSGGRIEDNQLLDGQGRGLWITGTGNQVSDNIVRGNADNYDIDQGNQLNLLLGELPESIDWPASVKLAGTLTGIAGTNGITVNASDVTIDLDGHALVGVAGSLDGIGATVPAESLVVRNGHVRNWGQYGINANSASGGSILGIQAVTNGFDGIRVGSNARIEGCSTEDNGLYGIYTGSNSTVMNCGSKANGLSGIRLGPGNTIGNCAASENGHDGILTVLASTINECAASDNGVNGINAGGGSAISRCRSHDNAGSGIATSGGSSVSHCTTLNNDIHGIQVGNGCTVNECTTSFNQSDGILVASRTRVINNTCDTNGNGGSGAGVHATGDDNRIDGNTVTDNDRGLDVDVVGNLIIRNSASGNGANYSQVVGGNTLGEVVDTTVGGGTLDENDSPWANFSF